MSIRASNVDSFDEGRRHVIAAVHENIDKGVWSHEERANWLKVAVHLRQVHRGQADQRAYYAGVISGLKSRLSTPFSGCVLPAQEYETGWDWEGDEDSFGVA